MKKNKYWSLADSEISLSSDIDDAIQAALAEVTEQKKEIPSVLTLTGFVKMKPDVKSEAVCVLDNFLESLDWNFSYYDDIATEPTERMKKAALRFVKEVLKDYEVSVYEQVCIKKINVKRWLKKNSDWYK